MRSSSRSWPRFHSFGSRLSVLPLTVLPLGLVLAVQAADQYTGDVADRYSGLQILGDLSGSWSIELMSVPTEAVTADRNAATIAAEERAFVLQKVQPALLGLMDGSVSTLAPIFAAAGLTG